MSSTKASSAERRFTSRPFFTFTLRQNKHQFALYVIIVLLAMILPCIIAVNDMVYYYGLDDELYRLNAEEAMQSVGALGIFVSGAIALFAGMGTLSYVNSKQATGCYHSLPVRREWMFLTETAVRSIYYIIAITFGYAVAYFTMLGTLKYAFEFTAIYLQYALCAVVLFMYVYSIVLLAAGLTGTAFMRFAMTAIITFLPFILYILVLATFNEGDYRLDFSYNMRIENLKYSFSFIRVLNAMFEAVEYGSVLRMLLVIPESALYYGIALVLHKYRRSEQAGNTIVWKPLFTVIKYVLIVSAALLGMVVFGVYSGSTSLLFFGTLFGLVSSFMLVNSIMYRSPRLMFRGVKQFIAVSVIMLLYVLFVPLNVTGLVGKAYPAWNTHSMIFVVNGEEIEITDRDSIKKIVPNLKEIEDNDIEGNVPAFYGFSEEKCSAEIIEKYGSGEFYYDGGSYKYGDRDLLYTDDGGAEEYESYLEYFTVIQKPRFGIALEKSYAIQTNSEIWDIVTKTEEYAGAYTLSNILVGDRELEGIHIDFCFHDVQWFDYSGKFEKNFVKRQIPELLEICELKTEYRENSPVVAVLELYIEQDDWTELYDDVVYYPVYAADLEALEYVNTLLKTEYRDSNDNLIEKYQFEDAEDYYRIISKKYIDPVMIDLLTGEARMLTSEQLAELAPHTASFGFNYSLNRTSVYRFNGWVDVSTSRYMIVAKPYIDDNKNGDTVIEIRFRDGAITDAELEAFFEGLEK